MSEGEIRIPLCAASELRGIGRRLVEAVAAEARARGLPALSLTTDRHLAWNRLLYERLGFTACTGHTIPDELRAILDREVSYGHSRERRVAMIRPLEPA